MHAEEAGRACAPGVSPSCSQPLVSRKRFSAVHILLLAAHHSLALWHTLGSGGSPPNLPLHGCGVEIIELDVKLTFGNLPQMLTV